MKAVIMAAGEGRRLEPLTEVRPKPMLPVANKPLLEYVVTAAVDGGVDGIVLVVGHKRERIQSYFGDGVDWGVPIEYALQENQLGTGHAILQAEPFVDEPFIVLNGDRVLESWIIEELARAEQREGALLAVRRSSTPSHYGVVQVDGGALRSITEKPPQNAVVSDIINAGVYRFGASIFDVIRSMDSTEGELTVTSALERLVAEDLVRAAHYDGYWLDVSYLWDYVSGNAEVIDRFGASVASSADLHVDSFVADDVVIGDGTAVKPNATVLPGTSLGDNVRVGPNAVTSNAVVFDDVTIGAGSVVEDCVIAENATVGPETTICGGPADVVVNGLVHEGVRFGAVVGDNSRLGGSVTTTPGTVVGSGVDVETDCLLSGRVPSATTVRRG